MLNNHTTWRLYAAMACACAIAALSGCDTEKAMARSLPPSAAATPPPAAWQGAYKDGLFSALNILPSGKFELTTPCNNPGHVIDAIVLTGTATMTADGWLHLAAKPDARGCPLNVPFHYYGVRSATARFLVAHRDLIAMVNHINAGAPYPYSGWLLLRDATSAATAERKHLPFDLPTAMPPEYRAMLRNEPLVGAVTRVERLGSEQMNVAREMMPPDMREQFISRVTVNRGSGQGVFAGMRLYTAGFELIIERVRDNESDGTLKWMAPNKEIAPGSAFSSRP